MDFLPPEGDLTTKLICVYTDKYTNKYIHNIYYQYNQLTKHFKPILINIYIYISIYICKLHTLVALRGQKSKKNGYLRIQGRMQIFEKLIPEGFKSRFDTLER